MPIFEFCCNKCNEVFETLCFKSDDIDEVSCPSCGANDKEKVLSSFCSLGGSDKTLGPSSGCAPSSGFS